MKKILSLALLLSTQALMAQRLPDIASPTSYVITFTPDLQKAAFKGEETIQLHLARAATSITLNAAEIEFKNTTITAGGKTQTAAVTLDAPREMATLVVPEPIAAGDATIHIEFNGILNDKLHGFYLSKGRGRNYATTQFENTDARRAFPGFDEPSYKATFDITLVVDKDDTAISNGKIVSDTTGPGAGKHTLHFSTTPKMSSYLVAMAVGDWQCAEGGVDAIPIRVCSTPDKKDLTAFALASAEHILSYYDQYFGIKYPYGKLDILAVPDFEAGAMENTAAIFYREPLLLIDDKHASVEAHKNVAEVLAHEMAHQWFGDLVTMQWWDDIWLNEGFATWMTSKPVAAWKPGWKEELSDVQNLQNSLDVDSGKATRAIRQKAETPEEINELFDGIAYGKSAAVLRMIERYVGPETFRKGVNNYLKAHAYGNAKAEDFWTAIAEASGKPIDKIMPTFVDQPGVPLVTMQSTCENHNTSIPLAQQRFFSSSATFGSAPAQTWQIPVCLQVEGKQEPDCQILDQRQKTFSKDGCSQNLFANAGASGYYRTQYSSKELEKINAPQLKPAERLSLVSDEWALVRAAQSPIGDYLSLVSRLKGERESQIVVEIFRILDNIGTEVVTEEDRVLYQAFVSRLVSPIAQELGLETKSTDADDLKQLRPAMLYTLAHTAHDAKAIAKSRELVERYLRDRHSVDPSLIKTALTIAAENGDAALYEKYLAAMNSTATPEEFYNFELRLANFSQQDLVARTLSLAVSPKTRNQDAAFVIAGALQPRSQSFAWPWIQSHWDEVRKQTTMSTGEVIVRASARFCDVQHRDEVQQFFAEHKVPSSERTLRQAVERINSCIDMRAHQQQNLHEFLKRQPGLGSSGGN